MTMRSLAVLPLLLSVLVGGCWDHVPVEQSAFAVALGVDPNPRPPGDLVLTLMIVRPSALAAGMDGGAGKGEKPDYLLASHASTVQGALSTALRHVPRVVKLDHVRGIVLGQAFAESGVDGVVGWALRQPQIRPFIDILVTKEPAQVFLDALPVLEPLPGNTLFGVLREVDPTGLAFRTPVLEFARQVLSPRQDALLPLLERWNPLEVTVEPGFEQRPPTEQSGSADGGGNGAGDNGGGTPGDDRARDEIRVAGLAVFKGDRMVGVLEAAAARGAAIIKGGSLGTVAVTHPSAEGRHVGILFTDVRSSLHPTLEGDRLRTRITVRAQGEVFETGVLDTIGAGQWIPELEARAASAVAQEVRLAMERLQRDFQSDAFGIAETLYRHAPADWHRVKDRWDEMYAEAEIDVEVRVALKRTGTSR